MKKTFKKVKKILKKVLLLLILLLTLFIVTKPQTQAYTNNSVLLVIYNNTTDEEILFYDDYDDEYITLTYVELYGLVNDVSNLTIIRRGDILQYVLSPLPSFDYYVYEATNGGWEGRDVYPNYNAFIASRIYAMYHFAGEFSYNEGYIAGDSDGYLRGLNETAQNAYDEGYSAGVEAGINHQANDFYEGIETWLVPAIIVVMFVGGVFSVIALKRKQEE